MTDTGARPRYRILSLDGGGIRGLLAVRLLQRLEEARPGFLGSIDLLAGTSTGAFLALALAAGLEPSTIGDIYRRRGREVFDEDLWDLTDIDRVVRADYRNEPLEAVLTEIFGTLTMGDLPRKVLVATFDLDSGAVTRQGLRSWKAKFVHNFEEEDSDDRAQRVVDVAMRSSAAPTYFPVYQGFIDGGIVANNPSTCALAQALHAKTGGQRQENVALLSVGTGANPRYLEAQDSDWGYAQWIKPLVNIVMEGGSGIADYQCRQILGDRYLRVNPLLPEPGIPLDDVDSCPMLEAIADEADLDDVLAWYDQQYSL